MNGMKSEVDIVSSDGILLNTVPALRGKALCSRQLLANVQPKV